MSKLNKAPNGATHYDKQNDYFKFKNDQWFIYGEFSRDWIMIDSEKHEILIKTLIRL